MASAPDSIPYCGPAPDPASLWTAWNLDPPLIVALLAALAGLRLARRRGMFLLGWLVLAVAFVSPLCALTVSLFSARALHHLLLVTVAAPALAAALPLRILPAGPAFALAAGALALWHLPAVYAAAWGHGDVYWLMQAALLLPAWAFWSRIVPSGAPTPGEGLAAAALLGGLAGAMGLIGAVLTFAPRVLYPQHLDTAPAWGLAPLADQQLAGLVMWVPGFVPLAALAALAARRVWHADPAA